MIEHRGITCIELSPLRRWLAVGLKGQRIEEKTENPSIAIYDTITQRKKYVLSFKEERVKYWVSLAFPSAQQEAKYIVSLSGNNLSERSKDREFKERQTATTINSLADKVEGEIIASYWSLQGGGKVLCWIRLS